MTIVPEEQAEIIIHRATLHKVLNKKFPSQSLLIESWTYSLLGEVKKESQVYRIHCTFQSAEARSSCSLILKMVNPDESRDREDHYYYWKREALVYQSGMLEQLPDFIRAPICYLIEEQTNGGIWLWLEDMDDQRLDKGWTEQEQKDIAKVLGRFNGTYLTGWPVPTESFVCSGWMNSWVQVIESYLVSMEEQKVIWNKLQLNHVHSNVNWERYDSCRKRVWDLLETLNRLPRVFAHQDIHSGNVYMDLSNGYVQLVMIDWQFASISGVGEELGRMFGLILRKHMDVDKIYEHKEALVQCYLEGLNEAGWKGNADCVRFGFTVTASLRFVMIVDKLLITMQKPDASVASRDHLVAVLQLMLDMNDEAWRLRSVIT